LQIDEIGNVEMKPKGETRAQGSGYTVDYVVGDYSGRW